LTSMQATLIDDHRDPALVVSRIWTLAVQDLTQVGILVSCVIVGWLLTSMLLHSLGLGIAAVAPKGKLDAKLPEPVISCKDIAKVESIDLCSHDVERQGLALLEHYGVFGSAPGAWTVNACKSGNQDVVPGEELESKVLDQAPLMPRTVIGSRTPRGLSLLEQYGVFGVSSWKETASDDFGKLLTSIT